MAAPPLSALLSYALVAFTIELDNEFEHQMRHRTTLRSKSDRSSGPWLVSAAMWSTCMRFVSEGGITIRELERAARTTSNLSGLQRWGYITIDDAGVIHATRHGKRAQVVWAPLFQTIEQRWRERFGNGAIDELRASLEVIDAQSDPALPNTLPILGYGLIAKGLKFKRSAQPRREDRLQPALRLRPLLSRALLTFAVEYESEAHLSLAIGANILRLVDEAGVRVRDLPRLAGISKEAVAMALGFLERRGYAMIEPDSPDSRFKRATLTREGQLAKREYHHLVTELEERWRSRFGDDPVTRLRRVLESIVGTTAPSELLLGGIQPYADGWRASAPPLTQLPHYPTILHRGGYPDGS